MYKRTRNERIAKHLSWTVCHLTFRLGQNRFGQIKISILDPKTGLIWSIVRKRVRHYVTTTLAEGTAYCLASSLDKPHVKIHKIRTIANLFERQFSLKVLVEAQYFIKQLRKRSLGRHVRYAVSSFGFGQINKCFIWPASKNELGLWFDPFQPAQ